MPDLLARPGVRRGLWVAGALVGAGALAWGISRAVRVVERAPDCSVVGPKGGDLDGFRYLERVTPGADPLAPLPMIVLFHSRGSRPEGHAGMLYESMGRPVRVILPEGPNVLGDHRSWTARPSKTSDQAAWADELATLAQALGQFVHDIARCRPTQGKPIMTGSSEGGHMAYLMASVHPDLVGGAVAVAGYLPQDLWSSEMAPTVGLHGEDDTAVPFARTRDYWEAMQAQGAPLSTQSFPGVGHSVPTAVSRAWRDALGAML